MLPRPNALWLYYPICWLALLALMAHIAFYDWSLITPIDVTGTFMGGMGGQLFATGWLVATSGLLLAMLLRLPGSTVACIGAGLLPLTIGAWWLVNYPEDSDNLIYSTSPQEIKIAMLIGVGFLLLGAFLRSRGAPSLSRFKVIARSGVAILLSILFISVPLMVAKQRSLPHCAFDKEGQQLTVCLSDEDERVIVD
ncbi:hypothetical protein [Pseudomonas sp. NPDC089534]|uniref:hypothetical protein n=1 Tax=Pseudomonas sp. NPDC089534 TaxID=3364468 RepID=UPI0038188E78